MFASLPRLIPLFALAAVVALGGPSVGADSSPLPPTVPGEVVVQLRDDATPHDAKRLAAAAGGAVERLPAPEFVTVAVAPGDEAAAIERLRDDPDVISAEVNALRFPQFIPADPLYSRQWTMPIIDAPDGWERTRGAGVTIAVLDTGIAYENFGPYRRAPQLSRADFIFPLDATDGSSHPNDRDGHGTHVTGTLAQDWDNVGVAGLVPEAFIIPVRVCSETGCPSDAVARGVRWAADHGADVINISLSGPSPTTIERDAFAYAESRNVVAVAAAGNGGADLIGDDVLPYPARYETVISVGAVNRFRQRTAYSNWGEHEGAGGLHIMAPGGNTHEDLDNDGFDDGILQETFAHRCRPAEPVDYHVFELCTLYGTSMAAPHVTGVAAMLLSLHPLLTPAQVRHVLACSARDIGPPGHDPQNGAGLVQADGALSDVDNNDVVDCLDPPPTLSVRIPDYRVLPGNVAQVAIDASVPYPGLRSYQIDVTFFAGAATLEACRPREGASCTQLSEDHVVITSEPDKPVWGGFRVAYLDMRAGDALGAGTSIHLEITAETAREPDIGLSIARDDGFILVADPTSSRYGDLDCDNKVGPPDVLVALRGNPFPCNPIADANCTGSIDAHDAIDIIAFLGNVARPQSSDCPPIGFSPDDPTPTPTPEPTPEPTPTEEATPTPTATPEP